MDEWNSVNCDLSGTVTVTDSAGGTTFYVDVCQWCGCNHSGACPRVKCIEYHKNGKVKRVEFHNEPVVERIYTYPVYPWPVEPYRYWWQYPTITCTSGGTMNYEHQ